MNSIRHRTQRSASRAFRLDGLPALAHANGLTTEHTMQARWSKTQPVLVAVPRLDKSFWLPCLAGLLAFGALAFGVFTAGGDKCAERESGNYSQSTLAPITAAGSDTAGNGLRNSGCKRKPGRNGNPKTAP
ncbi:MAG TPA: hypothetical protein VF555_07975 [Variovorax sp.]